IVYEEAGIEEVDPRNESAIGQINASASAQFVTVRDGLDLPTIAAFRLLAAKLDPWHPILLKDTLRRVIAANDEARIARNAGEGAAGLSNDETSPNDQMTKKQPGDSVRDSSFVNPSTFDIRHSEFLETLLVASTNVGSLLCDGIGDAVLVQGEEAPGQALRLSYNILQAAGSRIFKTDYVACPSCGRTLFNLQTTTARIKAATMHLKGVKIAIMGCIVNGPGEMADADFGYVGGAPGKVNLYVGKTPVKFNIPEAEAVERLQDLIREHGKWIEPAPAVSALA
ncbi:MAG TPA: flavodoxin-dependent (E)-4-hydroxy-3-methylbut-2-enyl-diphosphate synthase, partial [Chthoniobacterales bacterium]